MKNIRLVVEYEYDFDVLAIISSVKDYKIAWAINKLLHINLCKTEDICLDFVREDRMLVSNFIFETEYATFRLLKNRSNVVSRSAKNFLLPELKDYDYLIKVSGESATLGGAVILEKLRELPLIEYIKKIDIENLKSKENLIF